LCKHGGQSLPGEKGQVIPAGRFATVLARD
jgi:hypothetical protein